MIDYVAQFNAENKENLKNINEDSATSKLVDDMLKLYLKHRYGYHQKWMGRPIIQLQQDIISLQEAIMYVKPDLIIETGIAHGGGTVFLASMLELLGDNPVKREVVAIDIELRSHNRAALEEHPMWKRITVFEGSSIAPDIVSKVHEIAKQHKIIMVVLDSLHTHEHVYEELKAYAPLVTLGSYVVVFDTTIEFTADFVDIRGDRPWSKGNNPHTAAVQFLKENDHFICDRQYDQKSLSITGALEGWLLRVK